MNVIVDRKRKLEDSPQENSNNSNKNSEANKVKLEEGFSWWTCMQLGMSLDKTKPQAVPANEQNSKP